MSYGNHLNKFTSIMADLNIIVSILTCALLLYMRSSRWLTDKLRWAICIFLALVGIAGFIYTMEGIKGTPTPQFQVLIVPLLYNCFDRFFKQQSLKSQGRDFNLYRFQVDIATGQRPSDITSTDMGFSVASLFIVIGLVLTAALAFRFY
jgi:hypothetical protein